MQKYDVVARNPGTYEKWIEDEGVPIHEALIGVEDVAELRSCSHVSGSLQILG